MSNNTINLISNYDDMLYDSRPAKFNEYITDKYNIVHNELYNDALTLYIDKIILKNINNDFFINLYNVISMSNEEDEIIDNIYNNDVLNKIISSLNISNNVLSKCINLLFTLIDSIKYNIKYGEGHEYIQLKEDSIIYDFRDIKLNSNVLSGQQIVDEFLFITEDSNDENKLFYLDLYEHDNTKYDYTKIMYDQKGNLILFLKENDLEYNDNVDGLTSSQIFENIKKDVERTENFMKRENKKLRNNIKELFINEFKNNHKFIEIKNKEYWQPSSVYVISKVKPFNKYLVDLKLYWNNYQSMSNFNVSNIKINKEYNLNDAEIIGINYVSGIAKMYSKLMDETYEVPFEYLDDNTKVSEEMSLQNTFGYMLQ